MTGVMGFMAQCAVCPQRAMLTDQVDEWLCPRCLEVADTAVDETKAAFQGPLLQPGDRVAVELPDGRLFVGCWDAANHRVDLSAPDPDPLPRALKIMGDFVDYVESLGEDASPIATATAEAVAADYESEDPLGWVCG